MIKLPRVHRHHNVHLHNNYLYLSISNWPPFPTSILIIGWCSSNPGAYLRGALGSVHKIKFATVPSHLISCPYPMPSCLSPPPPTPAPPHYPPSTSLPIPSLLAPTTFFPPVTPDDSKLPDTVP